MINNIISRISFIGFCVGMCLADSENLLIPILLTGISLIVFKITSEKIH